MAEILNLKQPDDLSKEGMCVDQLVDLSRLLIQTPTEYLARLDAEGQELKYALLLVRNAIDQVMHELIVYRRAHAFTEGLIRHGRPQTDGGAA